MDSSRILCLNIQKQSATEQKSHREANDLQVDSSCMSAIPDFYCMMIFDLTYTADEIIKFVLLVFCFFSYFPWEPTALCYQSVLLCSQVSCIADRDNLQCTEIYLTWNNDGLERIKSLNTFQFPSQPRNNCDNKSRKCSVCICKNLRVHFC